MEALAGARFNSCLLNLYRDGRDAMGWHSDNEALYGAAPTIGAHLSSLHAGALLFDLCMVT